MAQVRGEHQFDMEWLGQNNCNRIRVGFKLRCFVSCVDPSRWSSVSVEFLPDKCWQLAPISLAPGITVIGIWNTERLLPVHTLKSNTNDREGKVISQALNGHSHWSGLFFSQLCSDFLGDKLGDSVFRTSGQPIQATNRPVLAYIENFRRTRLVPYSVLA